jgi:hypothetical protein
MLLYIFKYKFASKLFCFVTMKICMHDVIYLTCVVCLCNLCLRSLLKNVTVFAKAPKA